MRNLTLVSLTIALAVAPTGVSAQEIVQLDRFEVTAQKRVQAIQDVPIAVTAYSGDFLQRTGASDFKSLAPFVPGLFIQEQSPNNPGINIRGITTDSGDPRSEARVSIFQDGVSISRSRSSIVELFDLERIEILKGPQGTLFGRAAEIGAVSIIQNKAKNATATELTAGFGNFSEKQARGFTNAVLAKDQLFGRLAFAYRERDGTIDNVADGSDLNGKNTRALRGSLRWQPAAATTVDLIVNWQHDQPPGVSFKSGVIPPTGGDTSPFTFAELNRGRGLYVDRTVWGATAIVEHDLSPAWSLTSITGWREFDSMEQFDADGSRLYLLEFAEEAEGRQFSEELRANFDTGGAFTGFVGGSYFYEEGTQNVPFYTDERQLWPFLSGSFRDSLIAGGVPAALVSFAVPAMNPFVPASTLPVTLAAFNNPALPASLRGLAALAGAPLKSYQTERYIASGETAAVDLFADGTWNATTKLKFTAGLRGTYEDLTSGYEVINGSPPTTLGFIVNQIPGYPYFPSGGKREANDTATSWVGRLIAQYDFSRHLNVYAGVARGRRASSPLVDSKSVVQLQPELVWNYEVGAKGALAGGRIIYGASAFLYDYSHFQTTIISLGRFITADAGNATGKGFEFTLQGAVTDQLTAFATWGYTDATFDDEGDNGQRQQYAGYAFRLTAKNTVSLGGTYMLPVDRAGRFYVTPIYQYRSKHYFDDNNAVYGYGLRQDGVGLFNVRAGWRSADNRWELGLYVDNLFDKDYLIDAGNTGGSFGIPTYVAGDPRLFGITGTTRF